MSTYCPFKSIHCLSRTKKNTMTCEILEQRIIKYPANKTKNCDYLLPSKVDPLPFKHKKNTTTKGSLKKGIIKSSVRKETTREDLLSCIVDPLPMNEHKTGDELDKTIIKCSTTKKGRSKYIPISKNNLQPIKHKAKCNLENGIIKSPYSRTGRKGEYLLSSDVDLLLITKAKSNVA